MDPNLVAKPKSLLPTSCGEETGLPGVPGVGCVATVAFASRGSSGSLAATVIASSSGVYLLGPDLQRLSKGEESLATRKLWEPPVTCVGEEIHVLGQNESVAPHCVALTAFLVRGAGESGEVHDAIPVCLHDVLCLVVAWADIHHRHHISTLLVPLIRALSSSTGRNSILDFTQVLDVLPLKPTQCVLRLFYESDLAANHMGRDGAVQHVVMCSCYTDGDSSESSDSASMTADNRLTAAGGTAQRRYCSTAKQNNFRQVGQLLYLALSLDKDSMKDATAVFYAGVQDRWLSADPPQAKGHDGPRLVGCISMGPASEAHVAPWLQRFRMDRVVCSFSLRQQPQPDMVAAMGTTDGRVVVLGRESDRLLRRLSGPIADLSFVRLYQDAVVAHARSSLVDELLLRGEALEETEDSQAEEANGADECKDALVVLDSIGRVLIMRGTSVDKLQTQLVADIQQIITLAEPTKPAAPSESPPEPQETTPEVSRFGGLGIFTHFFQRRKMKSTRRVAAQGVLGGKPREKGLTMAKSMASMASSIGSMLGSGADEGTTSFSGHILSRGLLCVSHVESSYGTCELIVSTMGQLVVSIPFEPSDGRFSMSGFTITPAPMFFVGFADFWGSGRAGMVMASLHSVLVAHRPRSVLKEKAMLLLRLLGNHHGKRAEAESVET